MFYSITGLDPVRDMGGFGFCVKLWPAWRDAVARSGINQQGVEHALASMGRSWLDVCGFDGVYDPDNCGFDADTTKPPGPNAAPSYRPNRDLRVRWGEWGPEHIAVPGNACGLDIDRGAIGCPGGGRMLVPHNVDCWRQVQLLLITFCWFGETLALQEEIHFAERSSANS